MNSSSSNSPGSPPVPPASSPASALAARPLQGRVVMVIDDSNTVRKSAELFLTQLGAEVLLAEDGFDALAKIADHSPDLILCDIVMPRLDGYQTCSLLKQNPRFAATKLVMLSSRDGLFDRARGEMAGALDHLTKPFSQESLLTALLPLLTRSADEGQS